MNNLLLRALFLALLNTSVKTTVNRFVICLSQGSMCAFFRINIRASCRTTMCTRKVTKEQQCYTLWSTCEGLIQNLEKRFSHLFQFSGSSKMYAAAAVCHPNFKLRWVPADKRDYVKAAFLEEARKCVPNPAEAETQNTPNSADDFFDFEENSDETTDDRDPTAKITIECLRYLDEPCTQTLEHLHAFPVVKLLFRTLNATVPSSAPVERLFSKASLISLPRRNRLNDRHFEQLLLLKANAH